MAGAMGVAERLLALEVAVAVLQGEVQALAAAGAGTTQAATRAKSRPVGETPDESAGDSPKDGAYAGIETGADPDAGSGAGAEPSGLERLAQQLGNARLAAVLARAGYTSPEAVAAAPDAALLAVDGVGERALRVIREKMRG